MSKQLPLPFGNRPNARPFMPEFEPIAPPDPAAAYRQLVERAKTVDVTHPRITIPEDFYQEVEPHLPCGRCSFPLQPKLHHVMVAPGRFLCLDCFEEMQGLEHFTVDAWLDEHEGETDWRMDVVENYITMIEE